MPQSKAHLYFDVAALCSEDYCENGGLCIVLELSGDRYCSCPSGFGGERCQIGEYLG